MSSIAFTNGPNMESATNNEKNIYGGDGINGSPRTFVQNMYHSNNNIGIHQHQQSRQPSHNHHHHHHHNHGKHHSNNHPNNHPNNHLNNPHASQKFSAVEGEHCIPAARSANDQNNNNNNKHTNGWMHSSERNSQQQNDNNAILSLGPDEDLKVSDLVSDVPFSPPLIVSQKTDNNEARFTSSNHLLKPTSIILSRASSTTSKESPAISSASTVLPSEYVNSMSNEDRFDARKMGLASRTFDSALSHMLDSDLVSKMAANAAPDVKDYDKYARTSSRSPTRSPTRHISPTRNISPTRHLSPTRNLISQSPYSQRLSQSASKPPIPQPQPRKSRSSRVPSATPITPHQAMWGPASKVSNCEILF